MPMRGPASATAVGVEGEQDCHIGMYPHLQAFSSQRHGGLAGKHASLRGLAKIFALSGHLRTTRYVCAQMRLY